MEPNVQGRVNQQPQSQAPVQQSVDKPKVKSKFKIILLTLLTLIILIAVGTGSYYLATSGMRTQRACTMEAKLCPDGSSVGRNGPNCEFAPCPTEKSTIPTLAPSSTANWQTYKGNEFEFKYPQDYPLLKWILNKDGISFSEGTGRISFGDKLITISALPGLVEGTSTDKGVDLIINTYKAKKYKGYIGAMGGMVPQSIIEYQIFHPDGKRYFLITMHELTVKEEKETEVINAERTISPVPKNDENFFDQIVSTFKFTDSTLNDLSLIKQALADSGNGFDCLLTAEGVVNISNINSTYAVGTAHCSVPSGVEWGTVKIDGKWTAAFVEQQYPKCSDVDNSKYKFPTSFVPKCFQGLGNEITR
jgi:hypothetical protein